jgi:hypothetical protein
VGLRLRDATALFLLVGATLDQYTVEDVITCAVWYPGDVEISRHSCNNAMRVGAELLGETASRPIRRRKCTFAGVKFAKTNFVQQSFRATVEKIIAVPQDEGPIFG